MPGIGETGARPVPRDARLLAADAGRIQRIAGHDRVREGVAQPGFQPMAEIDLRLRLQAAAARRAGVDVARAEEEAGRQVGKVEVPRRQQVIDRIGEGGRLDAQARPLDVEAHLAALQRLRPQRRIAVEDAEGGGEGPVEIVQGRGAERLVAGRAQGEGRRERIARRDTRIDAVETAVRHGPEPAGRSVEAVVVAEVLEAGAGQDLQPLHRPQAGLAEDAQELLAAAADVGAHLRSGVVEDVGHVGPGDPVVVGPHRQRPQRAVEHPRPGQ